MDNLYIIIPAYNEEVNIRHVVDEWYPVVDKIGYGSRLIVIDDGSTDNTYKIIQECAETKPMLIPITKQNAGHGAAILFGYHYAIKHDAAYIFQTDSDGQTLPEEFEQFWDLRKKYDMVIGYRKNREDGWSRIFVTKILKMVIKMCFHVSVTDANTPYRLMETTTLKRVIGLIPQDFNLSNVLISVIYAKKGLKVQYIQITFRNRRGG